METSFLPLLFGGDINVYSMARAFHEAYGIRSAAYGKFATGVCYESAILDYRVCAQNEDGPTFFQNVCGYAGEHPDKTVLVIGCGDSYVKLAARYRDQFPANVIAPYIDYDLMDRLTNKEKFYELCDQFGIDHPGTFVYRREMGHDFQLPFGAPYICKPSNGVAYWEHDFPGSEKVFCLPTREALEATLDRVYAAGYPDSMIIQEFIPGDDSFMRVLTCYSGADAKVRLMCLGHVLLEDSGSSWRPCTLPAFPTSTSSTTSGTGNSRPLRSTPARGAATTTSPARDTTWPGFWWRTGWSTGPSRLPSPTTAPCGWWSPAGWPTITPPGAITRRCAPSSRRERSPIPCGTARIPP